MPVRDDPEAWQRLRLLVERIALLDPVARDAVIRGASGDDPEVEAELRNLLAAHDELSAHAPEALDTLFEPIDPDRPQASAAGRTHVGEFRLAESLGNGPRGTVYRAERLAGEGAAQVALKLLDRVVVDDAVFRRFESERDKLLRLDHPHIAKLDSAARTRDGTAWQAVELLDAQPVTEWCAQRSAALSQRLDLFLQACGAIRAAHAHLLAHRDIKPANVVVTGDGAVRVLDFDLGVAMPMLDAVDRDDLPAWPANAAPEQVRGEASGVACDVYQLGALLYELLCGRNILREADVSAAEIEATILNRVPVRPSESAASASDDAASRFGFPSAGAWSKALRGDLDAIVLRALRKEPAARYASVEQLVDDIARHRRGEAVAARADEPGYARRRFARRHRWLLVVLVAAAIAIAAFVLTRGDASPGSPNEASGTIDRG